jgi:hypothetical protein
MSGKEMVMPKKKLLPPKEGWYMWKELLYSEGETTPRLITPHADPKQYEYPVDYLFKTPKDAIDWKREFEPDEEEWILCLVATMPIAWFEANEFAPMCDDPLTQEPPEPRIKKVCKKCGSDDVTIDGALVWNVAMQEWEWTGGTYDKSSCCNGKCQGDCEIVDAPVEG